jgi:hypothetical protein
MQGAMVFEPIPAMTSLLMSLQAARFGDPTLEAAISSLGGRMRQARPSDLSSWPPLYREALRLLDMALQAQTRIEESKNKQQAQQQAQQQIQAVKQILQSVVSQQRMDWGPRLRGQLQGEQGMLPMLLVELEKLPVTTTEDSSAGLTSYAIEPATLVKFVDRVQELERKVLENDQDLVAIRANEALKAHGMTLPQGMKFFIEPAKMRAGRPSLLLEGVQKPTPSAFEFVGGIHRTAMAIVGGVSSVGFVIGRMNTGKNEALAQGLMVAGGVVLMIGFVFAGLIVPPKIRQGRAQARLQAEREVRHQLRAAVEKHINALEQDLLHQIQQHLNRETNRWLALSGEHLEQLGSGQGQPAQGLMPQEAANFRTQWRPALETRLRELAVVVPGV